MVRLKVYQIRKAECAKSPFKIRNIILQIKSKILKRMALFPIFLMLRVVQEN